MDHSNVLKLRGFEAALRESGLSLGVVKQYLYRVRAALRAVGVTSEADVPKLAAIDVFRDYLSGLSPQGRGLSTSALKHFVGYAKSHGATVSMPEGTVTRWGVIPEDVRAAWRRLARLLTADGVDPGVVPWEPPGPVVTDVLRVDADGVSLVGPQAGYVTYTDLVGHAKVLYRWASERAGGDPAGLPVSPESLLRALAERSEEAPQSRPAPTTDPSPEDWDDALDRAMRPARLR
mgnify:CR=1 FL=1